MWNHLTLVSLFFGIHELSNLYKNRGLLIVINVYGLQLLSQDEKFRFNIRIIEDKSFELLPNTNNKVQ